MAHGWIKPGVSKTGHFASFFLLGILLGKQTSTVLGEGDKLIPLNRVQKLIKKH